MTVLGLLQANPLFLEPLKIERTLLDHYSLKLSDPCNVAEPRLTREASHASVPSILVPQRLAIRRRTALIHLSRATVIPYPYELGHLKEPLARSLLTEVDRRDT